MNNGSLTLENCSFSYSHTSYPQFGGAIYSENGFLTIERCIFSNLSSSMYGSAIYFKSNKDSTLSIEDCIFESVKTSYGNGGSIYCEETIESNVLVNAIINNCTFTDGGGNNGGMVYGRNVDFTISSCVFSTCSVNLNGGAVYLENGLITMESCTFTDGGGSDGGMLYFISVDFIISSCEFTTSLVSNSGGFCLHREYICFIFIFLFFTGALSVRDLPSECNVRIIDSEFSYTSAEMGGGVYLFIIFNLFFSVDINVYLYVYHIILICILYFIN
jgi:hypothetical protein